MFVSYTVSDRWSTNLDWLDDPIGEIQYVRADSYDKTAIKNIIQQDAHPDCVPNASPTYRHFVPRREIINALVTMIQKDKMTRREAFTYLSDLTSALEIAPDTHFRTPPPKLEEEEEYYGGYDEEYRGAFGRREDNDPYNILEYHAWLTWAMEAIADWPGNIYLGFGIGDGQGTEIDVPYSPGDAAVKIAFLQWNRCVEYSLRLVFEIQTLAPFYEEQMRGITEHTRFTWRPGGVRYRIQGAMSDEYLDAKF